MKRIGIIAALDEELSLLKSAIIDRKTEEIAHMQFCSGQIGCYEVVIVKCGIGKVSAALCAQLLIARYSPDYIINTGCAGAISEDLKIGDTVIAVATAEWDIEAIDIGYPRGYISTLDRIRMDCDEDISSTLCALYGNIHKGLIVSGDQFVMRHDQRQLILDNFPDALCTEMEGAAIGHVCAQNNVPFCVVRSISDQANGNSINDFTEFAEEAGERSAGCLIRLMHSGE